MINSIKRKEVYDAISHDLRLFRFNDETDESYHSRLVYSALCRWITTLFKDRDFEFDNNKDFDEDIKNNVSKSHVTLEAKRVLKSFIKIDPSLTEYFKESEDKRFLPSYIEDIEKAYCVLGYVDNGHYTFKKSESSLDLKIGNRVVGIGLNTDARCAIGIGLWKHDSPNAINLNDFYLVKDKAIDVFKSMINTVKFSKFENHGEKFKIYSIDYNKFLEYTDSLAKKFKYSIVKVDGGFNYKVICFANGELYIANLPKLYDRDNLSLMFHREHFRLILGMCAYFNKPCKCYIAPYFDNGIKITLAGYALPLFESSILKLMTWPYENAGNSYVFTSKESFKNKIIELMEHLSIEIVENCYD